MRVITKPDKAMASHYAANLIASAIKKKKDLVLGLATGNTPIDTYKELVKMYKAGEISFRHVTTFNLDEYYGLAHDHPASYHRFMQENLFSHIDIPPENVNIPDGTLPMGSVRNYCREYENKIQACGGLDLQVLGIGMDGHIGFNEPGSSLASSTRLKTLSWNTKIQNGREFGGVENVPDLAITMGIGTIMKAKMILLLAFGQGKSYILSDALEGPITSWIPASILQMHRKVKVVVDEEAAMRLRLYGYYKHMEEIQKKYSLPDPTDVDREDIG